MAAQFAYTSVPNTLRQFLKGLPERAVPTEVTAQYLKSIRFKNVSDKSVITVLKFIGLLNADGTPSDAFRQYRDRSKGPAVLADRIRKAYKDLYETYEDAQIQSDDNLQGFFSAKTHVGPRAIQYMIATFKVLCEFTDFSTTTPAGSTSGDTSKAAASSGSGGDGKDSKPSGPQIHINLQIHLPASDNPATYDAIFDAIARKLGKPS